MSEEEKQRRAAEHLSIFRLDALNGDIVWSHSAHGHHEDQVEKSIGCSMREKECVSLLPIDMVMCGVVSMYGVLELETDVGAQFSCVHL